MLDAIALFRYIFNKFIILVFDEMTIEGYASFGWIIVSIIVMGILVNSILNIPNNIRFNKKYNGQKIKSRKGTNNNG